MKIEKDIETFILEDNKGDRELIQELLDNEGISPYALFSNSKDLIEKFHKEIYLVIVDFYLSEGRDGVQVVKELREINPDVYIIIMSGQDSKKVFIQLIKVKANDYVDKDSEWLPQLATAIREGKKFVISMLEEKENKRKIVSELVSFREQIKELQTKSQGQK